MPNMVTSTSGPNDNAHSVPRPIAINVRRIVAARRDIWNSSQTKAMNISLIEMVDVSEASTSRKKNNVLQTSPPCNRLKIEGRTSKTSLGPASASIPNEKTAGNIITPAKTATSVSSKAVVVALLTIGVRSEK